MTKKNSFYVTTPIYYATARPHLGSLYSTLIADVIHRWHQLQGKDSYFLTGTDEHGQKIAQAAAKQNKYPKAFIDQFIPFYQNAWQKYGLDYNRFIRTTDSDHIKGAQQFIQKLLDSGDIYKSSYEGWYCTPCETFVTEKDISSDQAPACPSCGRETIKVSEETYFFKLSKYQDKLLQFYKDNPNFIVPKERMNEVTSFVKEGLKDLSISRTTVKWGVPFPDDTEHTVYVWVEALCNYITAIGFGDETKHDEFVLRWPADVHVLGKDIVRFHGVFWPAFLMAAGLPLPKHLLVHGWIKVDKEKMSKSLGNVVDPMVLYEKYGAEPVRYYLMRQIPINQDGEFNIADLEQRINSDLANDLGNLLNRVVALAEKNNAFTIEPPRVWSSAAMALRDESWNTVEDVHNYMDEYAFHRALARVWKFINQVNAYFHEQEPWKLARTDKEKFLEVLSATCHSLRVIAVLLWPYMPRKMTELLGSLGIEFKPKDNTIQDLELDRWHHTFKLKKIPALFTKIEITKEEQVEESKPEQEKQDYISIQDLAKVELIVGTIVACEPLEKSEKLLKLQVDLGVKGVRQILAGIRAHFTPEELIGKQGVFVANLKPRKMMGLESQGMMLMAEGKDGKLERVTVSGVVPNGTQLR